MLALVTTLGRGLAGRELLPTGTAARVPATTVGVTQGGRVADPPVVCAPPSSRPTRDDEALTKARAGGLVLAWRMAARQCSYFSVFAQSGIELAVVEDFTQGMLLAYQRLASDAGITPNRRPIMYLFTGLEARTRGYAMLVDGQGDRPPPSAAPAFESGGDVWVDAGARAHTGRAARISTAAHELTHTFVAASTGGRPVPLWLNEGLAVYAEVTIPEPLEPAHTAWDALDRRRHVLDALSGKGSQRLLALDEITSHEQWDANYANEARRSLQYAQSYATVRWLIDRHGLPAVWKFLRDLALLWRHAQSIEGQTGVSRVRAAARPFPQPRSHAPASLENWNSPK